MLALLEAHKDTKRNKAYCELDDVNQMQFATVTVRTHFTTVEPWQ